MISSLLLIGMTPQETSTSVIPFVGGHTEGYAGTTSDITISLTSLSGGLATQPSANDIVVAIIGSVRATGNGHAYLPTGYTDVSGENIAYDSYDAVGRLCYKIMGSTPDTELVIPGGTGHNWSGGAITILVFRGVDQTTPLDVTYKKVSITNSVKPNPAIITPITSGAVVIGGGVGGHNDWGSFFTSSDLSNFISSYGNDDGSCTVGAGFIEWSGGDIDPAEFGFTGANLSSYSAMSYTLVLRPA